MSGLEIKEITGKSVWDTYVLSVHPKSFLQSWNWGQTNKLLGKKIFRLGVYNKNRLVGVCLIIKEKARRGTHFLIPAGPLIDWNDKTTVRFFISYIKNLAHEEKAIFIRVRPELLDSNQNRKLFRDLGFVSAPMHLHAENTWVLSLARSEAELLAGMRKSTRYLVRKSLTMDLKTEISADPNKAAILKKLQDETVERLHFVGFSEKQFELQLSTFGKDNQARIFISRKGKTELVASIVIFYGDYAFYHHSGSSNQMREIPASYFTQWSIIREAKARGCKYYDMWGAVPKNSKNHRFSGPSLFKEGFGCDRIDWLHAQDLPLNFRYIPTYIFETVRRKVRRL